MLTESFELVFNFFSLFFWRCKLRAFGKFHDPTDNFGFELFLLFFDFFLLRFIRFVINHGFMISGDSEIYLSN